MKKYSKYLFYNCFKAGIVGILISFLPTFEQGEFSIVNFTTNCLTGFIAGYTAAFLELFVFRKYVRTIPFFFYFLFRTAIYSVIAYLLAIGIIAIISYLSPYSLEKWIHIENNGEVVIFLQIFKNAAIIIILLHLDTLLGDGTFRKFILGEYRKPQHQNMIFMFLDVKSSTRMAEELGDDKFYELVNDFFKDISKPIIQSNAEIYKYIGDEAVICWPYEKGFESPTCVDLFFLIKNKINRKKNLYLERYGVVPQFKAGMHAGSVITAQIGDLRKEIVYNGDVLNTTARIEEICDIYNEEFIITEMVYSRLELKEEYDVEDLGLVHLKGKKLPLRLYAIRQKNNA